MTGIKESIERITVASEAVRLTNEIQAMRAEFDRLGQQMKNAQGRREGLGLAMVGCQKALSILDGIVAAINAGDNGHVTALATAGNEESQG